MYPLYSASVGHPGCAMFSMSEPLAMYPLYSASVGHPGCAMFSLLCSKKAKLFLISNDGSGVSYCNYCSMNLREILCFVICVDSILFYACLNSEY